MDASCRVKGAASIRNQRASSWGGAAATLVLGCAMDAAALRRQPCDGGSPRIQKINAPAHGAARQLRLCLAARWMLLLCGGSGAMADRHASENHCASSRGGAAATLMLGFSRMLLTTASGRSNFARSISLRHSTRLTKLMVIVLSVSRGRRLCLGACGGLDERVGDATAAGRWSLRSTLPPILCMQTIL